MDGGTPNGQLHSVFLQHSNTDGVSSTFRLRISPPQYTAEELCAEMLQEGSGVRADVVEVLYFEQVANYMKTQSVDDGVDQNVRLSQDAQVVEKLDRFDKSVTSFATQLGLDDTPQEVRCLPADKNFSAQGKKAGA
mgnify:CR=1 FL=1